MESVLYQRIRELCGQRGITLSELADAVGISKTNFPKWGSTTSPSIDKVRKIADYFHVSIDYLIGDSEIPQNADAILQDADIISLQRARLRIPKEDEALWESSMEMLRRTFERAFAKEDKQ